ncbi:hypothetical protein GA0115259_106326 [Streptomyces sp. MnatMP-M17]|nr:hypothetical protein GA0115259_106326 [Streptomyces sp. MnatMP-M17]
MRHPCAWRSIFRMVLVTSNGNIELNLTPVNASRRAGDQPACAGGRGSADHLLGTTSVRGDLVRGTRVEKALSPHGGRAACPIQRTTTYRGQPSRDCCPCRQRPTATHPTPTGQARMPWPGSRRRDKGPAAAGPSSGRPPVTGADGLSADIAQNLWTSMTAFQDRIGNPDYRGPAAETQKLAQGQGTGGLRSVGPAHQVQSGQGQEPARYVPGTARLHANDTRAVRGLDDKEPPGH